MGRIARCARISLWSCLAAALASPATALPIRAVAVTGDVAPGTSGATYATFLPAVLDESGRVAFGATLAQGGAVDASNDLGLWSEGSGANKLVAREGSPAPGGGSWGASAAPPALNDAGQVAFRAATTSPSTVGVWSQGGGTLAPVAVSGNSAAGAPSGQDYTGPFSEPALNDTGQVAFTADLAGSGVTASNDSAVWAGATGSLAMVAREGDAAPGAGGDSWSSFEAPLIDSSGGVAFGAELAGGGSGIWAGPASGVALAARDGQTAPGTTGEFSDFAFGDLNDQGKVAFEAGLAIGTGGVGSGNNRGVWAGAPGSLGLVAREGDVAPDTGGRVFESFEGPLINDAGDVLFLSVLDSGSGLFLDDGTLSAAVASGDLAPGTSVGSGDATFAAVTDWALNDVGEIAFEAVLGGALQGVTGSNDESLWLLDSDGVLNLIVREGMLWEIGLDTPGIVTAIDFFGASDARGRGLNDRGFVAFGLTFSDGREGVFVVTPEPGTGALLALGLLGVALRRRR